MNEKLEIECQICHTKFIPNRPWQKYCSLECREKGKIENMLNWRNKQPLHMNGLTVEEIKNKSQYNRVYENIMKAFVEKKKGLSWSKLYNKSELKDKTRFNQFVETFCRLGILKKKKGVYFPSQRYGFEPLKLRGKDVIMNTDMGCATFHPSTGHSYTYYTPNIKSDYLRYTVENFSKMVEESEDYFRKGGDIWITMLGMAKNNLAREIWDEEILCKKSIYVLTKFEFCLDIIFDICEACLWLPEKTANEQWYSFIDIEERAIDKYIQKRYPSLNPSQIKKMHIKAEKEDALKEKFFNKLSEEIKSRLDPYRLEHLILIDHLGSATYRSNELTKMGIIKSINLDRNKPIGEQLRELDEKPYKKYYDNLADKDPCSEYKVKPVDERLYIKPPFFKSFFQEFEKDLTGLGLKKGKLEKFYKDLDEVATILRIPVLPDDPATLL